MKNAKHGRPQSPIKSNSLLSRKLCNIVPIDNFSKAAAFFGVKRDAAKKYLEGTRIPSAESIQILREMYAKEHGGLLIDVNWLLDDSNERLNPVFSEINIDRMRNRIYGIHAYFVGIYENNALYYSKVTRGERRNLVPLVLGDDPENTIIVPLEQDYLPAIKGVAVVPVIYSGDYIPDDLPEITNRSAWEAIEQLPNWMAIAASIYAGTTISEAAKNGYKYIKGKINGSQKNSPPAKASGVRDVNPELLDAVFVAQEALVYLGRHIAGGQHVDVYPKILATRDAIRTLLEHLASSPQPPDVQDHIA